MIQCSFWAYNLIDSSALLYKVFFSLLYTYTMKTGQIINDNFISTSMINSAIEILKPVIESSIIFAAHYSKKCGRDSITSKDAHYGRMYAARNVTGRQIGSLFPDVYKDFDEVDQIMDEDEDEGEWETDEDEEVEEISDEDGDQWSRYEGDDQIACAMNECVDTWESWDPQNPIENYLKKAIGCEI
jgi:hypothetical protein